MAGEVAYWRIDPSRDGDVVTLRLEGELDWSTAPRLLAEVERWLAAGGRKLVVDLAGVAFADSSGLGALVGTWHRARRAGASLLLDGPGDSVSLALALTGLDAVLPLRASASVQRLSKSVIG